MRADLTTRRGRLELVVAALAFSGVLAGCSVEGTGSGGAREGGVEGDPTEEAAGESYTIELYASDTERLYLITDASDGARVAARVAEGTATLIEPAEARTLLAERQSVIGDAPQETMSFAIPGFSMRVQADETMSGSVDNARVSMDIAGRQFEVNTSDAGDGMTENAQVRLAGMSAADTREFIVGEDEIDPGVQQQMLDALGL